MLESSLISIIGISIPEEYIIMLTTALLAGRKELVNFKNKTSFLKMLMSVALTVAFTNILVGFIEPIWLKSVLQTLFAIFIYNKMLGAKWYEATIGLLATLLCMMVVEFGGIIIMSLITGISYISLDQRSFMVIVFSIPARIIEFIFLLTLLRLKEPLLNLEGISLFTKEMKITIMYMLSILFIPGVFFLKIAETYLKSPEVDFIMLSVFIALFVALIYIVKNIVQKLNKQICLERQNLHIVKDLLSEFNNDGNALRHYIEQNLND